MKHLSQRHNCQLSIVNCQLKKALLTLILASTVAIAMAAPVSQETTQRLANFFFHEQGGTGILTLVDAPQYPHIHIYAVTDGNGFIILSADDVVFPVLAYSTTTPLDITDMAPGTAYWLGEYENQIRWNIEKGHTASEEVTAEWQHLNAMKTSQIKPMATSAPQTYNTANLLTTTWSQGSNRYNAQCPYDSDEGERTLTGCVATAMAQILKYWGHPLRGVGSYSYVCAPYGTQAADFSDTVFNYSIMPNKLTSSSSQTQIDAVALLMRRCGIAVEMEYGTDGSAASTIGFNTYRSAESAYNEHFKYMHTLHAIGLEDYTDAAWVAEMKNEINNGRPVHYSAGDETSSTGSGHSFICCGYDNTGKLYFNWGWSGTNDGYYQIGQLNPGSDHYNSRNRAIVGIIPDTTNATTTTVTLTPSIPGAATLTGAGTYNSYTDWVTIKAMGTSGYLVDGWDGSNTYNPFQFLANGGNVNHTAICTPMRGDTLGYCRDSYSAAWGSSSSKTHKWGIRLDSVSILPNRALKSIKTYFAESGAVSIELYYGTATEPVGNPIKSYNVTIKSSDVDNWGTLNLPNAVPIDRSQSLWIVFSWTGQGYPMACSDFRGNIDGEWVYNNSKGKWMNYATDYTDEDLLAWMIRGIFAYNPGPYAITVDVDDTDHGTATGAGTYAAGATATLAATAKNGYKFREWNDGDKNATRTITVKDVAHYTAYFDQAPGTGVGDIESEMITVYSNGNDIIIENAADATAAIYDAAGRLVMTRSIATSHQSIALPAGCYFVHVGGKSFKAVVSK